MPSWQPIHENHAIDVMAALLNFGQRIPDTALRKMLRSGEEAAFANGLKSRHATHGMMQLVIGAQGVPTPSPMPAVSGFIFNSTFENTDGAVIPSRIAEQLQLDANQIIYRTWSYVSWSWQIERMKKLLLPPLEIAMNVVSLSRVRLEYLDRFWYDGQINDADVSVLLREDSPYLAKHIFEGRELWHLHTGGFSKPPAGADNRLKQIIIDAFDAPAPNDPTGTNKRWVHIVTAIEDRFASRGLDEETSEESLSFGKFDEMHTELKSLFAELVTGEISNRILLLERKP